MLITAQKLMVLAPNITLQRANIIAELLHHVLVYYRLYNAAVLPDFLAQLIHESAGFRFKEENLNYSAKRICAVWPSRFPTIAAAAPYAKNPKALANKVYGGRMGNNTQNDGWENRGSGFIMITGKDMAEQYGLFVGNKCPADLMHRIRTEDYWAMDSAAWLFAVNKKLIPLALKDDIKTISRRINGGVIGLTDRQTIFKNALKLFKF